MPKIFEPINGKQIKLFWGKTNLSVSLFNTGYGKNAAMVSLYGIAYGTKFFGVFTREDWKKVIPKPSKNTNKLQTKE